ncbi:MAG: beta-propeller fold lactonase family protein [Terriglobales bacterium]
MRPAACAACALLLPALAFSQQRLPTGQLLTPTAAPGARLQALNPHLADLPGFTADGAVTSLLSPDGRTLLVLTSGYNQENFTSGPRAGQVNPADSGDYVFVFDVTGREPRQTQALRIASAYGGLAFAPDGRTFYASGGDQDRVHVFALAGGSWKEQAPLLLGHKRGLGNFVKPEAAGMAVSPDGRWLAVANFENDSLSVLATDGGTAARELDLRPGGEYPDWVVFRGNDTVYVSSLRDRQVVEVALAPTLHVAARIALPGQPNRMVINRAGTRLYAAQDNADTVAVIATAARKVLAEIPVAGPTRLLPRSPLRFGANPDALTLSPDGKTLYVADGGENAVAVVNVAAGRTEGLIPTGWYPTSVTPSADGRRLYVLNAKSVAGPNPGFDRGLTPEKHRDMMAANQYILQLEKAGLLTLPVPNARSLAELTRQVLSNDHLRFAPTSEQQAMMTALHQRIHHVIYIIKENRTYDQVLGDLAGANGDPKLVEFPAANTPNFHAFAGDFVAVDNFLCSGEVSGLGWPWSTAARATDADEKEIPPNYAKRGLAYETEGTNRNLNLNQPRATGLLPGVANSASPDGTDDDRDEAGQGFLWDAALRAGLTVRDYGMWVDGDYNQRSPHAIPELPNPFASHTVVATSTSPTLGPYTDPYFRGFDQSFPDYYRYQEWKREFDGFVADGKLPNLELIRMEHDHFGNFGDAIAGLNTPELQMADDDYSVGLLVDAVAHSRYRDDTLIFIVEDDAQNGGDHVDAHRSPVFIVGPYVRRHAVVSTPYDTVSLVRTMEAVLGLRPMNINDAGATPMSDVFDLNQASWDYTATPSRYLFASTLPIPHTALPLPSTHDGAYWARATRGMDFSIADHLDSAKFNRILWRGLGH